MRDKPVNLNTIIPIAIHEELLKLVKTYLLSTYRNDFGKYASKAENKYLEKVFSKAPRLIGQQLKYVEIDALARSRDLE